jgi:hypothetical protein
MFVAVNVGQHPVPISPLPSTCAPGTRTFSSGLYKKRTEPLDLRFPTVSTYVSGVEYSYVRNSERYQRELDVILRETGDEAKRASHLLGIAQIEQLFEAAAQCGISHAQAWRIIEANPEDPRSGVLALIEEVQER